MSWSNQSGIGAVGDFQGRVMIWVNRSPLGIWGVILGVIAMGEYFGSVDQGGHRTPPSFASREGRIMYSGYSWGRMTPQRPFAGRTPSGVTASRRFWYPTQVWVRAWVIRARETPIRRASSARFLTSPLSRSRCHSVTT